MSENQEALILSFSKTQVTKPDFFWTRQGKLPDNQADVELRDRHVLNIRWWNMRTAT
jgi:hypothetical protein